MIKKLNLKIENLFDHDSSLNLALDHSVVEAKRHYEVVDSLSQLENLSYVFNYEVQAEHLENLLAQLSCFFEVAFILQRDSITKKYKTRNAAVFGRSLEQVKAFNELSLPSFPILKVFKTSASGILKHYRLHEIDIDNKMNAYFIRLSDGCVLLVISKTAEPWIKLKIETLRNTLMKINFGL